MREVAEFEAAWVGGRLSVRGIEFKELFGHVMDQGMAVLRNVFPKPQLTDLKNATHDWGMRTQVMPPQSCLDANFHTIESGISPYQKTPHNFHGYNFNQINDVTPLSRKLFAVRTLTPLPKQFDRK